MSRTRLFSQIHRAMRQARFIERSGWSNSQFEDISQSRRDFLKASGLLALPVAVGLPMGSTLSTLAKVPRDSDSVLILGGGAAGLAAAYTLKKAGIGFRVLEASSRVGGRIFTQSDFNSAGQFVELGAEYVDTSHQALIGLAQEVGLEIQDMEAGDAHLQSEVFYFGGSVRYHRDLVMAAGPFARAVKAAKAEIGPQFDYRNPTPKGIEWDNVSLAEYLHSLRGKVEDWFLDVVAIGYTLEMGREAEEQSVLNLFWQVDDSVEDHEFELFGPSDETRRIKGGNSRLPERLAEILRSQPDALVMNTRVLALSKRGGQIVVTALSEGQTVEYKATQVICALPLSTLKQVEGLEQIGFSQAKLDCIQNMRYGQNSKIMMDFSSRVWRQRHGGVKPCSGWVMGDFASQNFWETSRAQGGSRGILTNFLGGRAGQSARPDQIKSTALNDLAKLFPTLPAHYQDVATAMNWNYMPLAQGSYICVSPGQYSRFFGAQSEPELNGQILFAGEHTSVESMGYMNGAYETGIKAAQTVIQARQKELIA